ncbi:hypothetical protein [Mongoliibacter ruber]|uniref:Uncharacterized protein n=1 Tax=Mongoliibacter ruber TaxID=1750599 RepID=A0A2T0WVE6_9BACT|nr:hypothetical protein [Mongoliibacter ruber]PRY90554.1 hypothetical protein CLW00_101216 [Mongoliibacter ruber]
MELQIQISGSRAGEKRIVIWEGINSMTNQGKFANIVWIVRHLDSEDNLIDDPDINQDRRVITPISDNNLVTQQGVLIVPENFENDEDYQSALESGIPEYTFWMTAIQSTPLPAIIMQAAQILDSYNRFDKA